MVFASQRWLGVRLDCLSALLTAATALASVIVSQDAGNYTSICNQQIVSVLTTGQKIVTCPEHCSISDQGPVSRKSR